MTTYIPATDELGQRFKSLLDRLVYLHDRWQDEREYEDWKDYIDAMRKIVPADTTFVKASKRPFGFEVKTKDGNGFSFFVTATQAGFHTLTRKVAQ